MRAPVSYISLSFLIFKYSISASSLPSSTCSYQDAKEIRLKYGHAAALPLYQKLLETYGDVTAATRIAASPQSMIRHDMACPLPRGEYSNEYHMNARVRNGYTKKDTDRRQEEHVDGASEEDNKDDIMMAIQKLRAVLKQSGYFCHEKVQHLFGVGESLSVASLFDSKGACTNRKTIKTEWSRIEALGFAQGPVYVTPVSSGPISQLPPVIIDGIESDDPERSSLRCLLAMFLLGFAVPRDLLSKYLVGGEETIELLQLLGLAFPCEMDVSMIVPYVHIFPLQVQLLNNSNHGKKGRGMIQQTAAATEEVLPTTKTDTMLLVTDLHPTILSRTTVGQKEDGAVMYIGPDSLALVQHLPSRLHVQNVYQQRYQGSNTSSQEKVLSPFRILDVCTGSGIQALYMLMSMKSIDPTAMAVCVDVNDRALRFVKFNALLNGIENDRVWTLKADLVSGQCLDDFVGQESVQEEHNSNNINNLNVMDVLLHGARHKQNVGYFGYNIFPSGPFDLILANPPFIPTPSYDDDDKSGSVLGDISKRYGLFSSGGSSGEEVLESIVSMSSRLLRKDHGLLAIVSEFMNPPTVDSDVENATGNIQESLQKQQSKLLYKLCQWWEKDPSWLSLSKSSNDNHINEEACVDVAVAALARGLLFTNQAPISCHTYAARRANDQEEYSVWLRHLQRQDIECVSPGLLYIETTPLQPTTTTQPCSTGTNLSLDLEYRLVPKYQELGSIWTPYNYKALLYTWCEWVAWQWAYS